MFVVFEGIDGSGKTTLSNRVARALRERGLSVTHAREGGKFASQVTQSIRELGRDQRNLDLSPRGELYLFLTRDVQLLEEVTRPALAESDVVIADRFFYTAEVLATAGRGLLPDEVTPAVRAAARGLEPDLVVLVDVDPHLARARRKVAKIENRVNRPSSRKGLAGVGLQHRLRHGYLARAAREPGRFLVVDNTGVDLDVLAAYLVEVIAEAHERGVAAAVSRKPPRGEGFRHDASTPAEALEAFLAWIDRRQAREAGLAAYLLAGLHGDPVDGRRRALAERAPAVVARALRGLDDEVSWQLREALRERAPAEVARSVMGLAATSPRAMPLLAELAKVVPRDVAAALSGVDTDEAWALRESLYPTEPDEVVASLTGIASERAWTLRRAWLADKDLSAYEAARAVASSVRRLDDEDAWRLRKAARLAAPVPALGSLEGLTSTRAWKWRKKFVDRAPKVVCRSIKGMDHPEAWALREPIVETVKEAIDSILALDGEPAWRLRERARDIWASTVVKSLGPLADTERGAELVSRQLVAHPENLSLLKHAAGIALGVHREGGDDD